MAINKKLISFATQAQFDVKLNAGDIDNRSIVFIEDTKRIWTHGVYFDTSWDYVTGKPNTFTPSAHTLGSHSDVTLAALANGNILRYDGSKWVNNTLAQAGIATPADITTAIDGIEIGGRNLLLNTQSFDGNMWSRLWAIDGEYKGLTVRKRNTDWWGTRQQVPVENGEYYTFSSFIKIDESKSKKLIEIVRHNGDNNGGGTIISSNLLDIMSKERGVWHRAVVVVKATQNCNLSVEIEGYNDSTAYVYLAGFKLEKGNKATDWTPAPEDQVSDWNVTNVNSFAFLKNKPTQLSQFIDNIGVATHIANEANPHAVTKSQVGLSNVDNTSDLLKPISNAVQTALNLKANLASPTFTGNVTAPTFIGALSGNATTANRLYRLGDSRDSFKPSQVNPLSLITTFSTQGALANQINDNDYSDVIAVNSYFDSTAGQINALSFDKSSYRINHFMGTFGASTWSGFKTLAYLTDNVASATKLASIPTTFTGTYPVTFNVNGNIYSHTGITYTGSTNTLTTTNFAGNLTGLASLNLPLAGGTMTGILTAQNNTSYTTKQVRNIILSPDVVDSSVMGNGDIWITYE